MRRASFLTAVPALLISTVIGVAGQGQPGQARVTRVAIVEAEVGRGTPPEHLQLIVRAATIASPLQPLAVRALGRLERTSAIETLVPVLLESARPDVRAAAAWALAQSAGTDAAAAGRVREALMQRLLAEDDADVRGAIGEALGRLPQIPGTSSEQVERALVGIASRLEVTSRIDKQAAGGRIVGLTLTSTKHAQVPMPALIGALRGLESLARARGRAKQAFTAATLERLRALATDDPATSEPTSRDRGRQEETARARRLALLCLLPVNGVDAELAARALGDPDVQVRRLAVSAPGAGRAAIDRGLKDVAWLVRYEALRAYGRRFQPAEGCAPILDAVGTATDHVTLLALDLLGNRCGANDKAAERLMDVSLGAAQSDWRRPAHALVALARSAPDRARPHVARFCSGEPWQSRMYAASAAALTGDAEALRRLAGDANDNVREAALTGLSRTAGHDADSLYVTALAARDFQLVMTAASALAGSPGRAAAVPALLAALARLTALDSDPARDPRLAVLDRLQELGSRDNADAVRPYLSDGDPRVADAAARVLTNWLGASVSPAPRPRPVATPPMNDDVLRRLSRTVVRVTMASGGQFDVAVLADLAPVSAALFVARASRGYYTGLTFHRILPNFLIQGGSPGANEFAGDTRYSVDEPGRTSQTRGTVGTSTRGRDTGDGQVYINLVDNPRLDHEYTVFAHVVRGMDVVDWILEGDVMRKVEVLVR